MDIKLKMTIDITTTSEDFFGSSIFEEPESFRPPEPEPTFHTVHREAQNIEPGAPRELNVKLVGSHSLWAHCLWNAGVLCAHYLDSNKSLVRNKRVLELGAAAALPSFFSAVNGAEKVVITDYPDSELIENMEYNARHNFAETEYFDRINIQGFLWGNDPSPLLNALPDNSRKFDLVILADLIFNHSQHHNMLKTVKECLSADGSAVCMFSHHRPWLADKDMAFFQIAQSEEFGFEVEELPKIKMPVMFEHDKQFDRDSKDEETRRTVHSYILRPKKN
ncbi:putative methyltransferase-domain-containing protein [Paraphysoderma sedebokerense]|nr:putative methyltransferase-domain-containing protein [Paraphysoderma sedebokerense]